MKLRLLAACIGATAILLLLACSSDDTATTSPTDEPTATEAPSSTSSPTLSPTATPTPSPTATPAPDADSRAELAYLAEILLWLSEGQRLTDGVSEISGSADPLSSSNEAKALELTVAADTWRDNTYEFDAPARYDETQEWVERAGVAMADSLEDFWAGIMFADDDMLFSAVDKMNTATEYINNITSAMAAVD